MNLYWIAGIAIFVLLEKVIPQGHWLSKISGVALVAWGFLLLMQAQ
jgi:predicted metal-binding membrane protein